MAALGGWSGCSARAPRAGEAPDAFEVAVGVHLLEAGTGEQRQHGRALVVVVLQQQQSAWGEMAGGTRCDGADGLETIPTTVESQCGLVIAYALYAVATATA